MPNRHSTSANHGVDIRLEDLQVRPLEQAETIPSEWYTDPKILELEKTSVFRKTWQLAGPVSTLRETGVALELKVGDDPIIVIRDDEDALRAFFSVCRHRGGPLRICPGAPHMLQCRYHGWTYRLDGSLRGVPRFDRAELFDKRDYGLVAVSADVWSGLVFVNIDGDGEPLSQVMDGIRERIAPTVLDGLTFKTRVTYTVACNWKVYVDNFLEGYHLPYVHPELCDVLDLKAYRTETFTHYSLQFSPIDAAKNPYHVDTGGAYYYFVYPNVMLNILPGRMQTNVVEPVDTDHCLVHFDYYYEADVSESRVADDLEYSEQVQQESIEICERVQEGLHSVGYDRGRFSVECEEGVWHFQSLLKQSFARHLGSAHGD
jgi:choline monooxygenase